MEVLLLQAGSLSRTSDDSFSHITLHLLCSYYV